MNQNDSHTLLKPKKEFETEKIKEYGVKSIINSAMYSKKAENQLPYLYQLVL